MNDNKQEPVDISISPSPQNKIRLSLIFFFSFEKIVSLGKGVHGWWCIVVWIVRFSLLLFFSMARSKRREYRLQNTAIEAKHTKKKHKHAHTHSKKTKEEWVSEGGEVRRVEWGTWKDTNREKENMEEKMISRIRLLRSISFAFWANLDPQKGTSTFWRWSLCKKKV